MAGYSHDKTEVIGRLRRIEGQVRGIQRMVDDDRYCIDVLTQVTAAEAALRAVGLMLLGNHVEHCMTDALRSGDADAKVRELSEAVQRFVSR